MITFFLTNCRVTAIAFSDEVRSSKQNTDRKKRSP
jgi:hypothetical protein